MVDDHQLMLETRPVANEQKRANRVMEWLGGVSLMAVLGAVWFGAQQFQSIDIALKRVTAVGEQVRSYQKEATKAMYALDRQVTKHGVQLEAVADDVDTNQAGIDKISDRMHFLERRTRPDLRDDR